jgi:hypothetical protein
VIEVECLLQYLLLVLDDQIGHTDLS